MKINFEKVGNFIRDHKGVLIYGAMYLATAIVGMQYGVTVEPDMPKADVPSNGFGLIATNSKQTAISSITKTACKTGYAHIKENALRQIFEIASTASDDLTKSYAIQALQTIANGTGYSHIKENAQKFITMLAKGE